MKGLRDSPIFCLSEDERGETSNGMNRRDQVLYPLIYPTTSSHWGGKGNDLKGGGKHSGNPRGPSHRRQLSRRVIIHQPPKKRKEKKKKNPPGRGKR